MVNRIITTLNVLNSRGHCGRGLELLLIDILNRQGFNVVSRYGHYHVYHNDNLLGRVHFDINLNRCVFHAA